MAQPFERSEAGHCLLSSAAIVAGVIEPRDACGLSGRRSSTLAVISTLASARLRSHRVVQQLIARSAIDSLRIAVLLRLAEAMPGNAIQRRFGHAMRARHCW